MTGIRRGIEKESLRIQPDGSLAMTPHPPALGSALTHPHITTDFSEAQLELITGVHSSVDACLEELGHIHQFVYRHLGDELLWCGSMPCALPGDDAIPIARYGNSNVGRAKAVYRMGLAHRYGRRMQAISGLHYNFSVAPGTWSTPGEANQRYFGLIRNFRRHAWLLLYLFGASPAVCSSFVAGRPHELQELAPGTWYLPYATSLRMGRLGYLSSAQDALAVSYNDLASYAASLDDALTRPFPAYESIGIRDGDDYRQLGTTLLQIENEFYSTIRPKPVVRSGERPLRALRERGVEYVEVRAMDLDPFSAIGITGQTARFLDVFLLNCLLAESAPDTPEEIADIGRNKQRVAARGREPGLLLRRNGQETELAEWAGRILSECASTARALDGANGGRAHQQALAAAADAVADPGSLPSARMLAEIQGRHDGSYSRFALDYSRRHRTALAGGQLGADRLARFERMSSESVDSQRSIEASDTRAFEEYRRQYLSPDSLRAPAASTGG